jgi:holo-[acyl-carrier protein] synthase
MKILGVGIDLVDLEEFSRLLEKSPGLYAKLFCEEERKYTVQQLAGNCAAKESLFKACSEKIEFNYTEVAVHRASSGRPYFKFNGQLKEFFADKEIYLSITNKPPLVVANVVATAK